MNCLLHKTNRREDTPTAKKAAIRRPCTGFSLLTRDGLAARWADFLAGLLLSLHEKLHAAALVVEPWTESGVSGSGLRGVAAAACLVLCAHGRAEVVHVAIHEPAGRRVSSEEAAATTIRDRTPPQLRNTTRQVEVKQRRA